MEIEEVTPAGLGSYGQVPIRFWVRERWTLAGFVPVAHPWEKEYDAPGNRPEDWHLHFDLARWGFFVARLQDKVIGGGRHLPRHARRRPP